MRSFLLLCIYVFSLSKGTWRQVFIARYRQQNCYSPRLCKSLFKDSYFFVNMLHLRKMFFQSVTKASRRKNDSLVTMVTSPDVLPLSYRDSCVCITVSNSPNPSPVYIRLCKHGKGFPLNVFYKLSFPRRNAKLLVMALIKEKLSPVVKSCTRILARVITSCFAKNMLSKFWIFLA